MQNSPLDEYILPCWPLAPFSWGSAEFAQRLALPFTWLTACICRSFQPHTDVSSFSQHRGVSICFRRKSWTLLQLYDNQRHNHRTNISLYMVKLNGILKSSIMYGNHYNLVDSPLFSFFTHDFCPFFLIDKWQLCILDLETYIYSSLRKLSLIKGGLTCQHIFRILLSNSLKC